MVAQPFRSMYLHTLVGLESGIERTADSSFLSGVFYVAGVIVGASGNRAIDWKTEVQTPYNFG